MQLHFQVYGNGEPLVLLHGLFGSSDNWHSISLRLSNTFRVFAIDQRNHGNSPHHPEMTYPLMAADILALMRSQGISAAHFVGHSMGGKTAMELALAVPNCVHRLVVVDMAPKRYPPRHQTILEALLALEPGLYKTRKQIEEDLAPAIPDVAVRQFLLKNLGRAADGFYWKPGLRDIHSNYEHLNAAIINGRVFGGPALFIRGGRSDYVRDQDLAPAKHLFPKLVLLTIPDAGHWVHAEAPDLFFESLMDFLASPA